jgi:hypothetical protein
MEERLLIWRVAENIWDKQLRTANKGWYSSLGLGDVLTVTHHKNITFYEIFYTESLGPGLTLFYKLINIAKGT